MVPQPLAAPGGSRLWILSNEQPLLASSFLEAIGEAKPRAGTSRPKYGGNIIRREGSKSHHRPVRSMTN